MKKRIQLIAVVFLLIFTTGCSLFDMGKDDNGNPRRDKWTPFYSNYMEIYNKVQNAGNCINNGYIAVKNKEKYLVNYHSELAQIEKDLQVQKAQAEKITTPNGLNYQYSMSFLISGIDYYLAAIHAFNSIPSNPDVKNILFFEDQSREGTETIKTSRDYVESIAKKNK